MIQKKQTPYGMLVFVLLVLLIFGYLCSGIFNVEGVNLLNFQESMVYAVTHPLKAWNDKTPAFLFIAIIAWMFFVQYYLLHVRNLYLDIEHGSAAWGDVYKICKKLADENEENNRVLTENLKISLNGALPNNNMLAVGSSGDGKTTSLLEQNILQFSSSYVVLDVKGDIQRKFGNVLLKYGYSIESLNLIEPHKSDRYNPFVYIETESDVITVIDSLFESCRPKEKRSTGEPFWDEGLKLYLQALFFYEWLDARENKRRASMNNILKLANLENRKKIVELDEETAIEVTELQILMNKKEEQYGPDYPPVRDYKKLKEGATETVRTITLMVNSMLATAETAEVKRIFSGHDFKVDELGTGVGGNLNKKKIIFLCIPDDIQIYNWIVSMFYTQTISRLRKVSREILKKPLPVRVEFWLDEFYAGARPANTIELLGIVRSCNMSLIPILQSHSQLKALYGDDKAETIFDNTSVVLFLGSGRAATSTHKWISELLGTATVDSMTDNVNSGSSGGITYSRTGVPLMTETQVAEMPLTDAIVFLKGHPPIYDTKAFPFDMPQYGFKANKKLKKRYREALSLGEYEHPVYTVYDPEHFTYITVEREQPLQIITDPKEIQTYQEAAKTNKDIYTYNIQENELLYLSWGHPQYTQENVELLVRQAMDKQKTYERDIRGLLVLQDVAEDSTNVPDFGTSASEPDKLSWDHTLSLQRLLQLHWDDLSGPEQEEFCLALDEGLTEEQLRQLLLKPLAEMAMWRRAFAIENSSK